VREQLQLRQKQLEDKVKEKIYWFSRINRRMHKIYPEKKLKINYGFRKKNSYF
jgi:hypothetical protein